MHYVKKLFCSARTQFKISPSLVKDLQVPDARSTKEFVRLPESHRKWLVTPSDEQDYKEDVAQGSFKEGRWNSQSPILRKACHLDQRSYLTGLGICSCFFHSQAPFLLCGSTTTLSPQTKLSLCCFGLDQPGCPCFDTFLDRWGNQRILTCPRLPRF